MNALEAFNAGSLEESIELARDEVKKNPTDVGRRNLYCELLCWAGQLEKADKQLETAMLQDAGTSIAFSLTRQLIRCETTRQECFKDGRTPDVLAEFDEVGRLQMDLLLSIREQDASRSKDLIQEIDEKRPAVSGTVDDEPFTDLRDLDDTCATFFEVFTSTGKYFWIPYSRVLSLTFQPVKTPRDVLWRPAHMIVDGGPDGHVYLPMNYARSLGSEDKQLRLGRATTWEGDEDGPIQGLGRRLLFIGEEEKSLLDVTDFTFDVAETDDSAPAAETQDVADDSAKE